MHALFAGPAEPVEHVALARLDGAAQVLDREVGGIPGVAQILFAPFGFFRRSGAFGLRLARLVRTVTASPASAARGAEPEPGLPD